MNIINSTDDAQNIIPNDEIPYLRSIFSGDRKYCKGTIMTEKIITL